MTMPSSRRWIVVSFALVCLAAPILAEASYTSTIAANVATMTGNSASDTLTITQAGGLLKHNRDTAGDALFNSDFDFDTATAGDQTLSATDPSIIVNVNAGDGDDIIALGDGIALRGAVDGGPGIDTIDYTAYTTAINANLGLRATGMIGTLSADQENPATSHGATGTATVSNYNIVTHTFDITVNVAGIPPAEVNGFHIHRAVVGVNGPIIVDFTGVAPLVANGSGFSFTASGLTVPTLSEAAFLGGAVYVNVHTSAFPSGAIRGQLFSTGNASVAAGVATGMSSVVNVEKVVGGSGNDSIVGSFSANTLDGGGGADWIVAGPGADTLNGGPGADVLVWNNGDGSDVDEGGADGDTLQVNGSTNQADFFTISANGPRIAFARTNFGAFTLDVGTVETLIANGSGANDTFVVNDLTGVAALTTLNLNGFEGDEDFVASTSGGMTFNVNGGLGDDDTLTGKNAPGEWTLTGPGDGAVTGVATFRFVELLVGGTSTDVFNVKAFASGTPSISGGAGSDSLIYNAESRLVSGDRTPPDGAIESPGVQSVVFAQFENVTIVNAANTAPTITDITNQSILGNGNTGALAFTVGDLETAAGSLSLSANSSNPALVPNTNISFAGTGASRTVTVTPAANQLGSATITINVSDGTLSTPTSFGLTVTEPTGLQPPTELYVSAMSGNQVTFRFTPSVFGPAPTGFVIEGGVTQGEVLGSLAIGLDPPIFSLGLPTGSFYVRMHSLRGAEKSAASNEIRVHVNVAVPPSAPDSFLSSVNGNSVVLSWRNTLNGGAPTNAVLEVSGAATAQIPVGLTETLVATGVPDGAYTLQMRAANAAGLSTGTSAPVTITVPSACSGAPQTPSKFLAYRVGNTVNVVWEPPVAGSAAQSYVLNVSSPLNLSVPTTLRALGAPVSPGTYTFSVTAVNPCGSSAATPTQTVVVP